MIKMVFLCYIWIKPSTISLNLTTYPGAAVKTETSSAEPNPKQFGIMRIVLTLMVWYLAILFRVFLSAFLYGMSVNFSLSLFLKTNMFRVSNNIGRTLLPKLVSSSLFFTLRESLSMDLRK